MKIDISKSDTWQQEVISELGSRPILVSASAGAGKTRVLVTRLLKLCIEDRIPLSSILALTFTEAAAEEMKNRLSADLHALRKTAQDADDIAWIDGQITSLVTANITTIDSFCLGIIRKYCSVIGLDPACAANILSGGRNELLTTKAFDRALKALYETHPEDALDLCSYFDPRPEGYGELYKIVCTVNTAAGNTMDPDAWYDQADRAYCAFTSLRDLPQTYRTLWFSLLSRRAEQIEITAMTVRDMVDETEDAKLGRDVLTAVVSRARNAQRLLENEDYDGFRAEIIELAAIKVPPPAGKEIKEVRDTLLKQIEDLLAVCYSVKDLAASSAYTERIAHILIRLCRDTAERLREIKKKEKTMYFSDMERYALEILKAQDGRIADILHDSLEEIMIDEFQDTSVLQDSIIRLIAKEKRIFRVGDVKQSIYRFRQAKPDLMRGLMKDENASVFHLRYNYRSNKGIVDFTNLLFGRLLNIPGLKDVYGSEDIVGTNTERQLRNTDVPHVHLILLDDPEQRMTTAGKLKGMPAEEAKNAKAGWIAQKIRSEIDNVPGTRYGDFAVLVKSHADKIVLRKQFDRYGIAYDIDAREGFYQSDLCLDVLACARLTLDEHDELSMLGILTSPLIGMSDEEIAKITLEKHGREDFCDAAVRHAPYVSEILKSLRETAESHGVIAFLNALAGTITPAGISFYDALSERDRANFDFLFDQTVNAEMTNVTDFIREIEAGEDEKSSDAVTSGKDDDVVRVVTIHKSKGLQYKNVFLWGTGRSDFMDKKSKVMADEELLIGFRDIDPRTRIVLPTVQRTVIEEKADMEDMEEFNRLLYVAVTRAEEHLYIVDDAASAQEFTDPLTQDVMRSRPGITGLVTAALRHEDGLNEGGLLEAAHVLYEDDASVRPPVQASVTIPRFSAAAEELPPMVAPSSLEKHPQRSAGLPPLKTGTGGTAYGTMIHDLVEQLPNTEWTEEIIREHAPADLPDSAVSQLLAFSQSALYQSALQSEIQKEYPFYYEDREKRMNGVMDFVAFGDEIILIDFKTDRRTPEEIRGIYTDQILAYRDVLRHFCPGKTIRAYAWSFHNNCSIEIR